MMTCDGCQRPVPRLRAVPAPHGHGTIYVCSECLRTMPKGETR